MKEVPGGLCQLANQLALGAAIAFTEGMDGIDFAEVERCSRCEVKRGKIGQRVLRFQLGQYLCESGCEINRWAKIGASLGDIHDPELAGPRKYILKEIAMDGLKVRRVELAGDSIVGKLNCSLQNKNSFQQLQF